MDCQRCKGEMKDYWNFCPACGARKGADPDEVMGRDFFSQLLSGFKDSIEKGGAPNMGAPGARIHGFPGPVRIEVRRGKVITHKRPGGRLLDGAGRPAGPDAAARIAAGEPTEPSIHMTSGQGFTSADVYVPGVSDPLDVLIKELESSIEVKASSGEKLYFRILKKPAVAGISGVSLEDGVLRIRF
jgi:hypothetical protein